MPAFRITVTLHSASAVERLLEGLVKECEDELRAHPGLPLLYASGVRYVREPDGVNKWQTLLETYGLKKGDCEDLCAAKCAENRVRLGDTRSHCTVKFIHSGLWHVRVVRGNGQIEDPSKVLGMGQPRKAART